MVFEKDQVIYYRKEDGTIEKGTISITGKYQILVKFPDGTKSVDVNDKNLYTKKPKDLEERIETTHDREHRAPVMPRRHERMQRREQREDEWTQGEIDELLEELEIENRPVRSAYEVAEERSRRINRETRLPDIRYQRTPERPTLSRRRIMTTGFARLVELASTLPALCFAGLGLASRNTYNRIEFAQTEQLLAEHKKAVNNLEGTMTIVNTDLQNLWSLYNRHYYKSKEELSYIDEDGVPHYETKHYWDVPRGLPNEDIVRGWKDSTQKTLDNIRNARNHPVFDFEKGSAKVTKQKANALLEGLFTAAVYGIPAIALVGYEEALQFLSEYTDIGNYQASEGMSRRSVIKAFAALCGIAPAAYFMSEHSKQSDEGTAIAKDHVERIISTVKNLPDKAVISQVVGMSPDTMKQTMYNYEQTAVRSANAGIRQGDVVAAFSQLYSNSKQAKDSLERTFADGVPEELAMPMRNALGKKMVDEFNKSGHGKIYTNKLVEAGAFAGVLAVIMGGYELIDWSRRA